MSKHTPGPWHVVNGTFDTMIADAGRKFVAEVTTTGMGYAVRPNAELIAAAPDLLAALREITEQYERLLVESRITKRDADAVRALLPEYTAAARAAIAKATGEQA